MYVWTDILLYLRKCIIYLRGSRQVRRRTVIQCDDVSQKLHLMRYRTIRQRIGNFHDALCGVVHFYDATPQRRVVASPLG